MRAGRFELGGFVVEPGLSEAAFLAAAPEGVPERSVHNGVHRSYRLPVADLDGRDFIPVVCFSDGALTRLDLTHAGGAGGSWDDYSADAERGAQRENAAWLARALGAPAEFDWGRAGSFFDPKGGSASIVITFGATPAKRKSLWSWLRRR